MIFARHAQGAPVLVGFPKSRELYMLAGKWEMAAAVAAESVAMSQRYTQVGKEALS